MAPSRYYRNYLRTYVERDVRAMVRIEKVPDGGVGVVDH